MHTENRLGGDWERRRRRLRLIAVHRHGTFEFEEGNLGISRICACLAPSPRLAGRQPRHVSRWPNCRTLPAGQSPAQSNCRTPRRRLRPDRYQDRKTTASVDRQLACQTAIAPMIAARVSWILAAGEYNRFPDRPAAAPQLDSRCKCSCVTSSFDNGD